MKTTTLIGGRCTGGNVLSRAVLITRKLSWRESAQKPKLNKASRHGVSKTFAPVLETLGNSKTGIPSNVPCDDFISITPAEKVVGE